MRITPVLMSATIVAATFVSGTTMTAANAAATTTTTVTPTTHSTVARDKPIHVGFAFHAGNVTAHTRILFAYNTPTLPKGGVLYLQRQFGTKHAWRNVLKLKGKTGHAYAPPVALGHYVYRVQAVKPRKVLGTSPAHNLLAYGNVTLATICNATNSSAYVQEGCQDNLGTIVTNGHVFTYMGWSYAFRNPNTLLPAPRTSCRQLTVRFAYSDQELNSNDPNPSLTTTVVQTTRDQVSATVTKGIGVLVAKLDGGPFTVTFADTTTDGGYSAFFNGSAQCYTANGLR